MTRAVELFYINAIQLGNEKVTNHGSIAVHDGESTHSDLPQYYAPLQQQLLRCELHDISADILSIRVCVVQKRSMIILNTCSVDDYVDRKMDVAHGVISSSAGVIVLEKTPEFNSSQDISVPPTFPPSANKVTCVTGRRIAEKRGEAVRIRKNHSEAPRLSAAPRQDSAREVGYKCCSNVVNAEAAAPRGGDRRRTGEAKQYFVEFPQNNPAPVKINDVGSLFESKTKNTSKIPETFAGSSGNIISCAPFTLLTNDTSCEEEEDIDKRAKTSFPGHQKVSDELKGHPKKGHRTETTFSCKGGDVNDHLGAISAIYVSTLQSRNNHRKRSKGNRSRPETHTFTSRRKDSGFRVSCLEAGKLNDDVTPDAQISINFSKKINVTDGHPPIRNGGGIVKKDFPFSCESGSIPFSVNTREMTSTDKMKKMTNRNGTEALASSTKRFIICPSKPNIYASKWRKLISKLTSQRSNLSAKIKNIKPKYNMKFFKLYKQDQRGEMICHTAKNHYKNTKTRSKRSIKGSSPEMMYSFIEQAVQPGGHISLKCSASGDPLPRFDWMLDKQPLASSSSHRYAVGQFIDHAGFVVSHLNISGVRVEDGGLYECRASNSRGHASHSARLNVYGPPYIRSISTLKGITGGDITILCPYYGYPISYVKWESSRHKISSNPRYKQDGPILKISRLDPSSDAGSYICSVATPGGELARRELQLLINSPPVLSPLFSLPNLKSGERAQLSCTVTSGDMPIYFSWMKDGLPLSASLQIEERSAEFFSYLIFKSLSSSHSGSYTCIATNSAGKVNTSAELVIKVPPYWHYEPQDVSTLLGSSVFINCDAKGYPEPRTYWSKQHNRVSEDFDLLTPMSGHLVIFNNGSLLVNSISSQDEGNYRCTAENGIGNILYKNIVVDVNEPARFEVSSQNITTRRNDPVTLVCDILGDNPVQNIWTHNTNPIDTHNYRISVSELKKENGLRSQLSIDRADRQDSGLYRCQASNSFGRSEHFIHLAVQERPDPPTRVEVMQVGSRSVRLTWRRPFDGNSPVLGYLLQYQPLGPDARDSWDSASIVNLTIATSSIHSISGEGSDTMEQGEVSGLQPDTTYSMRMLAVNQIESSSFTETIMAKTHEEAPAESPQNVHVQPGEAGELIVTWQAPPLNSWHGPLMGYTVHWSESSDPESTSPQIPHTSSATVKGPAAGRFSISGLAQFTRYRVTVSAANRAGNGPHSVPVVATTKEGVPSAPPQSVHCTPLSSQSLKIEWASPPRSHHGGNLLGYKILYKPLSDVYMEESVSAAEVKRTSSSETYLHALLKYTNYSIQVLAYTGAGDGILSPAVFCTTEEDIPGPPANIKAISLTAESILISWLPPKKPNGNIVFYTLYYREAGRSGQPISRQISLAEASSMGGTGLGGAVEIRGLLEKGRYEFWLSASTGAGEGGTTSPVTQVTTARAGARIASFGGTVRSGTGRSLLLGCFSVGNPTPRARWLHSQRTITHSHLYRVTAEGNLLIHSVDQTVSGNYTCSAKNLFGSDEITYTVICLLPPGPPSLQLLYTTASSAQLQWTPSVTDGGSPILGYTLSYKRLEESLQIIELSAEVTSYKVDSLKCGSRYSFQITAHNRVGKGETSVPIVVNTKGEAPKFPEEWSDLIWSNASSIVVEVRRALGGNEGGLCPLLSLGAEWRRGERKDAGIWRAANVPSSSALVLTSLIPAQWYEIRLSAENHAGRNEALIRAATTTLSGALISPPSNLPMEPIYPHDLDGSQDNIFNLISIILATVAAISTLSVAYLLIMKRNVICHCANESEYGGERQRSQSQASDEKTICAEQQNIRNCQHDYSTSPIKSHVDKMRRESAEMYEISPYATFQVGGPNRPVPPSTLDHTLQFRTFGHLENDEPPLQAPCKRHFPQKMHKHSNSKDTDRIESGCELQPLRTKSRNRQCSGPSYCVPIPQQEIYQRESSTESNDMSPPLERSRTPRHFTDRQLQIHQSHS